MRLVNYAHGSHRLRAGALVDDRVVGLTELVRQDRDTVLPEDLHLTPRSLPQWLELVAGLHDPVTGGVPLADVCLSPPLQPVPSFRDFYAFEHHVRAARARRGLAMIPEWYEQPVFYFSNVGTIVGHGAEIEAPAHGEWLDFELEVAAIIGWPCVDVAEDEAEAYVAGYTVLNDWSLRDVQRREMKVGLGPAKGKDFATSLGPALVTPDELEDRRDGQGYDLAMTARINGTEVSRGNWKDITFGFGAQIARASQGVWLQPGDVIGSGTVGTGCILELGPDTTGGWLRPGDEVELEIERLGVLRNRIVTPTAQGG